MARPEIDYKQRLWRVARWLYEREIESMPRPRSREAAAIRWRMERLEDEVERLVEEAGPGRRKRSLQRRLDRMEREIADKRRRVREWEDRARAVAGEIAEGRIRAIAVQVQAGHYEAALVTQAVAATQRRRRFDPAITSVTEAETTGTDERQYDTSMPRLEDLL